MSLDRQHAEIVRRDGENVVVRIEPSGEQGVLVDGAQLRGLAALAQVVAERAGDEASEALYEQLRELLVTYEEACGEPSRRARRAARPAPATPVPLTIASRVEGRDDRARVLEDIGGGAAALIVADGAGGQSGAAEAAELLVVAIAQVLGVSTGAAPPAPALAQLLRAIDRNMYAGRGALVGADSVSAEAGETTALLAICNGAEVWGASAGDSAAFVLEAGALRELTAEQQRRPFVGSGQAEPRPFGPVPLSGPLLVCSDGLHKYCARDVIARQLAQLADGTVDVRGCVDALVEAARVGATADWHDDVAVIVAVVDAQKSAPTT